MVRSPLQEYLSEIFSISHFRKSLTLALALTLTLAPALTITQTLILILTLTLIVRAKSTGLLDHRWGLREKWSLSLHHPNPLKD